MTSKTKYIKTYKDTKISDPMIYEIIADKDNTESTVIIDTEENSKSEIIIIYRSKENYNIEYKAQCTINAENNSFVKVTKINLMNDSIHFEDVNESFIKDEAECLFSVIDIGAQTSSVKYSGNLEGRNSKNEIKSIYIGSAEKKINNDYECIHRGAKSSSDISVKGALAENAVKKFKGTIDFRRGCSGSKGAEDEYCMLLSDKARSIALPILLCEEEDVSGAHSASSGKIDESKIFYLMSRGLGYNEARKLIVKSQFNEVIDEINDSDLREEIIREIDRRLDDDR
ncbi:MAG: SufD family Fe-S cluster assembly protein [Inconstantimicrobium porci]|uniref:SufB/SufD family protein n=1 Tax=Inconstantimicrobium porci TaxID=2652291 RepID=UPI0024096771|nr:SufD family Fe-S cluster assembly protein [Inconstantimicrobium porci]MDD6771529.1 SufD family Fe-S cluster assembly protein [Inconstantimicrobium porci]MDY5910956.1 SufD family Fe-S cluster assembly protein [Inconstantimicrobium porci]